MTYEAYLKKEGLSASTVRTYGRYQKEFTTWLEREGLQAATFGYSDVLDFMRYLGDGGRSQGVVRTMLAVIRHYGALLILEGQRTDQPAAGLYVRGRTRGLPVNILSAEELEALYRAYSLQLGVDLGKKVMLGLLVYQGLTVGELSGVKASHIKLAEAKIAVRGTGRSNARTLPLVAVQMAALQEYYKTNRFKEGAFFTEPRKRATSENNIQNRVAHMMTQLRKLQPRLINAAHIRASVITHWLGQHPLREVQYMAGHKYVSTTERYQTSRLEDLQTEVQRHHPMQ